MFKYLSITLAVAVTAFGTGTASALVKGNDTLAIDLGSKATVFESSSVEAVCETPDFAIKHALTYIALFTTLSNIEAIRNDDVETTLIDFQNLEGIAGTNVDELASDFLDAAIRCNEDPETLLRYVYTVLKQNEILVNGKFGPYSTVRLEDAIARLYGNTIDTANVARSEDQGGVTALRTEIDIERTISGNSFVSNPHSGFLNNPQVAPPAFKVSLSQTSGPDGTRVIVTVTGATANAAITVSVDGSGAFGGIDATGRYSSEEKMSGLPGDIKVIKIEVQNARGVFETVTKTFKIVEPSRF